MTTIDLIGMPPGPVAPLSPPMPAPPGAPPAPAAVTPPSNAPPADTPPGEPPGGSPEQAVHPTSSGSAARKTVEQRAIGGRRGENASFDPWAPTRSAEDRVRGELRFQPASAVAVANWRYTPPTAGCA